jgi:hypothetical protein
MSSQEQTTKASMNSQANKKTHLQNNTQNVLPSFSRYLSSSGNSAEAKTPMRRWLQETAESQPWSPLGSFILGKGWDHGTSEEDSWSTAGQNGSAMEEAVAEVRK